MQCHPHSYGLGLSAIRATAAANGLYDLDLFAAFADDQMTDVSNFREPPTGEVRRTPQRVEKPLYAPSEHPSRTQKPRHRSVLALMSKCLDALLDYRLVLERLFQQAVLFHALG